MSNVIMKPAQGRARRVVDGSLDSSDVNLVPPAASPCAADDAEVASRQAPGQEEVVQEEPRGDLPDSRSKGDKTPQGSKSSFKPDTAPESSTVPDRGRRTPAKRSKPIEPASSVQPEAPDNLLEVLKGASIDEEHRTIMSTVV